MKQTFRLSRLILSISISSALMLFGQLHAQDSAPKPSANNSALKAEADEGDGKTSTEKKLKKRPLSLSEKKAIRKAERKAEALEKRKLKKVGNIRAWPKRVAVPRDTDLQVVSQENRRRNKKEEKVENIYETKHFRYLSEIPIEKKAQRNTGRLFECTFAGIKAISDVLPIVRPQRSLPEGEKYEAQLYGSKDSYNKFLGNASSGSAGLFRLSLTMTPSEKYPKYEDEEGKVKFIEVVDDAVHLPVQSLGLDEEGDQEGRMVNSHVLVHEITHQFTCLNRLPIWINEGISEYVAYVPFDGRSLNFSHALKSIVNASRRKKSPFKYPFTLEEFLTMEQSVMYEHMKNRVDTYYLSVLSFSYFVHMDRRHGLKNMVDYLNALNMGESPEDALELLYRPKMNAAEFQKHFVKTWAKHKIRIRFEDAEEEEDSRSRRRSSSRSRN